VASKNARAAFIDSIVDQPVSAPVAISEKLQERAGEMFDINNGKPEWRDVSTVLRARWRVIETLRTLRLSDSDWPYEAYERAQKKAFATALAELLPSQERTVLQLYFIDRREPDDIAGAIGLSMPIKSQREKFVNEIINRIIESAKKRTLIDDKDLRTLLCEAGEAGVTVLRSAATPGMIKPAPDNGFGKIGLEPAEIEALATRHIVTLTQLLRLRTNEFMKLSVPESIWREIVAKMLIADKYFADGEAATMQLMGLKGQENAPIVASRETETRRETPAMFSRSGVALRVTAADYRDKLTSQSRPLGTLPRPEPVRVVPKIRPAPIAKPSIASVRPAAPPASSAQIIPPQRRVEPVPEPPQKPEPRPAPEVREKTNMSRKPHELTVLGLPKHVREMVRQKLEVETSHDLLAHSSAEIRKKIPNLKSLRALEAALTENRKWLADGEEATRNLSKIESNKSETDDRPRRKTSEKVKGKTSVALVRLEKPLPAVIEASPVQVDNSHSNGHHAMSIGDFFQAIGQGMKNGTISSQMMIGSFTFSEGKQNYNMFVSIGKEKD
jgi:hypothetical protein